MDNFFNLLRISCAPPYVKDANGPYRRKSLITAVLFHNNVKTPTSES